MIVTSTPRLTRYLRHTQSDSIIIPLHEWLEKLWLTYQEQTSEPWLRISHWQSTLIWQRIIVQSIKQNDLHLLRPQAVVHAAQQAWNLLQQWQVPLSELQNFQSNLDNDSSLFTQWATEYDNFCKQQHWVDESSLANFLQIELKNILNVAPVTLYGFDYMTPQIQHLCHHLRQLGMTINEFPTPENSTARHCYYVYPDSVSELRAAIQWANSEVNNVSSSNPIGIIVPDLSMRWSQVQRICAENLKPDTYNIAGGLVLIEYPLLADTLLLLQWISRPLPYIEISHLLRSVFWQGSESELTARAQLTLLLAEEGYQHISITAVHNFINKHCTENCPELLKIIKVLAEFQVLWKTKTISGAWSERLQKLFIDIDWPNGRTLNSTEYQIWQRTLEYFQELSSLDAVIQEPYGIAALVTLLKQQARKILFQPESKPALIQILGVHETSGLSFSHLWVTGMTADAWPPEPKPNPFIPVRVQRQHEILHASYAQEYAFAMRCMQQWKDNASTLVMSYPQQAGDVVYEPSRCINIFSENDKNLKQNIHYLSEDNLSICHSRVGGNPSEIDIVIRWIPAYAGMTNENISDFTEKKTLETMMVQNMGTSMDRPHYPDTHGLPATELKGGIQLLQDQAECPFRAYANYRLGAKQHKLEAPLSLGTPLMRGIIVHRILHLLWKNFKTQQQLLKLDDNELNIIVIDHVQRVLQEHYGQQLKINAIPELFVEVEQERLVQLITTWLNKEKQRSEFKIYALEQAVVIILADLELNLRIDRIDALNNGEFLIIDYKISSQTSLSWSQERLTQPQLPLYALSHAKPLAGVVFAQVGGNKVGFNGLVQNLDLAQLPKATSRSLTQTVFPNQLSEWRTQLELLAQEYQQGYAAVDPYPNQDTCRYCDLHLLCRVEHD